MSRIVVDKVEPFNDADLSVPYEKLKGRAFGELDPYDPANEIITDLKLAPRNANGKVEYVSVFELTKPIDMTKASGLLWYDLVNRGTPVTLGEGAIRPPAYGHVHLISGWQGDLVQTDKNVTVQVPVARNPDGSPITGVVLSRLADSKPDTSTRPLSVLANAIPYDAGSLDTAKAHLIAKTSEKRSGEIGPTREIPSTEWAFADCSKTPFPGTPNPRLLCLKDGFDPKLLYELSYDVKDPKVLGVGLAAMRDVASFFRYEDKDTEGNANPVAGRIKKAITQGISQSGNALKTFILLGFNRDKAGRIVFDGANPHIAGRLTAVNVRFGIPSGSGTLYEPGGEGVLWWTRYQDKVRSRIEASLLDRCTATNTCPKIFETFGAAEFNARLMTVALTGTDTKADLPLPANVRRYYFPGTTHGGDVEAGFDPRPQPASGCVLAKNPNPETETMNALQLALAEWVMNGTEPPASIYPKLSDSNLVANTREAMGFPTIPGGLAPDGMAIGLMDYDFGPDLDYNDFSGVISRQPPGITQTIRALMPKVNDDGNEVVGIGSLLHQAPLGTYTGWNATAAGFFKGQPCGGGLTGGYIPFAQTKAERLASGDPRPSLEERYGTREGYMCVVQAAAKRDVEKRYLLQRDADRLIAQAAAARILPEGANPEANDMARGLCQRQ
ncbi:alpha/beta hydrolase domain-containing protein [Microvirga sesbaniae]|uniref:alpha/beta hydrolase domain-containing protein n=1 Tax=Microvirga sesbaniae TaxID=681392 RepID=UPI0021C88E52|nr:alpha/beta hydrolase domain-containing protein [Microvirga sp. HBU67692]